MSESLQRLSHTIAAHVAGLAGPSDEIRHALEHLHAAAADAVPRPFAEIPHDYAALVARAARNGLNDATAAIARQLLAVREPLPWGYHYVPRSAAEDLSEHVAFAELIGPDGPLFAPGCRVGFTVMAENTIYPLHAHPAVELYLVVSGTAQWSNATAARCVPPGELVLHRTNEPHAMRTFEQPLLALWSWSGNLDAPAMYL